MAGSGAKPHSSSGGSTVSCPSILQAEETTTTCPLNAPGQTADPDRLWIQLTPGALLVMSVGQNPWTGSIVLHLTWLDMAAVVMQG